MVELFLTCRALKDKACKLTDEDQDHFNRLAKLFEKQTGTRLTFKPCKAGAFIAKIGVYLWRSGQLEEVKKKMRFPDIEIHL